MNIGPGAGGGRKRRGKKGNLPNTFDDDCRLWIIGLPRIVKSIRYSCVTCKKVNEKTTTQLMGRLPQEINGANFPHLQPMAELRRNQRGEIGCQHVKAHSSSHFSPCFDHTSPTQTDDGTSQIDHDIGAHVPNSFRTMSRVLLRPLTTEVRG